MTDYDLYVNEAVWQGPVYGGIGAWDGVYNDTALITLGDGAFQKACHPISDGSHKGGAGHGGN